MNAKQLAVLGLITAVAVIAAVLLGGKKGGGAPKGLLATGDPVLGEFDANSVTKIVVTEGDQTTTLTGEGGAWKVAERDGYAADFDRIKRVVTGLGELEVSETVEAGESVLGRFDLVAPASGADGEGKSITLFAGEDELAGLVVGKQFAGAVTGEDSPMRQGSGNYVRNTAKPGQVFIASGSFWDIQGAASNWLKRRPFGIESPKDVEIAQPGGETFRFVRDEKGAAATLEGLAADEELNTANTGTLVSPFGSFSFSDVLVGDGAKPEATGLGEPVVAKISTFDGFNYTLKIGKAETEEEPEEEGDEPGKETEYFASYEVEARFADARVPGDDEKVADDASDEDKRKAEDLKVQRDKEFAENREKLAEKLEEEKANAGAIYAIDKWAAEKFFLGRSDLVKKKEKVDAPGGVPTAPSLPEARIPGLPNPIPGVVPVVPETPAPPTPPAEGTTPPTDGADPTPEPAPTDPDAEDPAPEPAPTDDPDGGEPGETDENPEESAPAGAGDAPGETPEEPEPGSVAPEE